MPPQPADLATPGFVYLFHSENGLWKIGRAADPSRRVAKFKSLSVEVSLVHQIETSDAAWLERRLHHQFRQKRVRGEWFALTEADVAGIARTRRCDPPEQRGLFGTLIAGRVQALREREGLSQVELARKAGLLLSEVADIESGADSDPRVSAVAAIARAVGASLDEVTGGAEEVPPTRRPRKG